MNKIKQYSIRPEFEGCSSSELEVKEQEFGSWALVTEIQPVFEKMEKEIESLRSEKRNCVIEFLKAQNRGDECKRRAKLRCEQLEKEIESLREQLENPGMKNTWDTSPSWKKDCEQKE